MDEQTLNRFNTDRKYSPDGQFIEWKVTGTEKCVVTGCLYNVVQFHDITRDILGSVTIDPQLTNDEASDQILRSYDNGGYQPLTYSELDPMFTYSMAGHVA